MRKLLTYLPILSLALFCLIVFKPFFFNNKLPIPSDTIVGLYHPWRDLYASHYPSGVPFKNFLITDPVRQQFVWRELAISELKRGQLPKWNPYSFSGEPLLANLQTAALYPLNFLYWLLPFASAWSSQVSLQIILGGLFMYIYLRHLKLHPAAVALGTISWVGSGFFVAWLEWNTLVQSAIWLPLILFSLDKCVDENRKPLPSLLLVLSLVSSFLAGHLQIFGYIIILTFFYFLTRLKQSHQPKLVPLMGIFLILVLILTFFQWRPMITLFSQGVRSIDPLSWQKNDWFLPWQHLAQFIAPDFFGNPATLNYFGFWNYGEFVGYVGITALVFALSAGFLLRNRNAKFFTICLILSLIFALPTPIAKIPYQLNIPLLSFLQPSRLMVLIDFSLAVLASLGFDSYLKEDHLSKKTLLPIILIGCTLLFLWTFAWQFHFKVSLSNLIFPSLIFLSCALLIIFTKIQLLKSELIKLTLIVALTIITVIDLARFTSKFEAFATEKYLYPQTQTLKFLQKNTGLYRIAVLDDQILPANISGHYGLQDVAGYNSVFLGRYAELISALEHNNSQLNSPLGFNRIIIPKNYHSKVFDLLNVKYLLTFDNLSDKRYQLVFSEGKTKVYQNLDVLPRAFFVTIVEHVKNQTDALKTLFDPAVNFTDPNLSKVAVVEDGKFENCGGQNGCNEEIFLDGQADIISYQPNEVVIKVETSPNQDGFLVLEDPYYSSWTASIDGKETTIFPTNFAFRGILVPPGKHLVKFNL